MIPLLKEGTRILNIDESQLADSNFTRKMWCSPKSTASVPVVPIIPRLSLIAAVDSEGRLYFSLTQATTDQNVMLIFLLSLFEQMDKELPGWRDDTIIVWDGAGYHGGAQIREYVRKMNLDMVQTAPYCYDSSPIEKVFAHLKDGKLSEDNQSLGKKVRTSFFILIA